MKILIYLKKIYFVGQEKKLKSNNNELMNYLIKKIKLAIFNNQFIKLFSNGDS